ncbi:MAG: hypothetical protein B7C55_06000 [Actinomycetales bacterium mxb001]|nr:MAG: hypothetical protein B7C55_06000 [Actinomycetales bacterium mxb001]
MLTQEEIEQNIPEYSGDCLAVFIACLNALNNNVVYGTWIELYSIHLLEFEQEVKELLYSSPFKTESTDVFDYGINNYAILKHKNFGDLNICRYEGLKEVYKLANIIKYHGNIAIHLAKERGYTADQLEYKLESSRVDHFSSLELVGREILDSIAKNLQGQLNFYGVDQYFNFEKLVEDYIEDHDNISIEIVKEDNGTLRYYVFEET